MRQSPFIFVVSCYKGVSKIDKYPRQPNYAVNADDRLGDEQRNSDALKNW